MKKIFFVLIFLVNFLNVNQACVHYPSNYNFWMFMPCIHEIEGIPYDYNYLSYTDAMDNYKDYDRSTLDTAHYHINTEEWYQYLGKKASKKEIFAILYHTDPSEYWYNDNERVVHNSFIKTLQLADYQEEKVYLDFAKACESAYSYTSSWDIAREDTLDSQGLRRLLNQGKMMLPKTTKPFVRLRLAFLLVKICDYLQNKDDALLIYEKYIKKSKIKSWVKASTMYHLGKITHESRYYLLAFIQSYDKRDAARRILMNLDISCDYKDYEQKLRNYLLNCAKNKEEQAAVHCLFAWKSVGRNLRDIQQVYAFSPSQKDIPLLIAKEIYDLEDWILTHELTTEPHYKDRFYAENAHEYAWSEDYKEKNERLAYNADVKYLAQFRLFIDKILKEKRAKNLDLIRLEAAHLAFLAKDYSSAERHLKLLKISQKQDNHIFIQKNILNLLIKIKKPSKTTQKTDDVTRQLFEYIDEHQKLIVNVKEFRSQIALLVGKNYIAKNDIPKGIMLLCQTDRDFGTLDYISKNAYH